MNEIAREKGSSFGPVRRHRVETSTQKQLAAVVLSFVWMAGCGAGGGNGGSGGKGSGGSASGGSPQTGAGGTNATGGQSATGAGGLSGTGGLPGAGGSAGSGGTPATGGSLGSGGAAGARGTGGAGDGLTGAGGTGGASGKGGSVGTGGSATGGAAGGSSGYTTIPACPGFYAGSDGGPAPLKPVPSQAQEAYQHTELTAFIHFGLDTFDGTEQGNTADTPSLFNPTNLDATQWVSSLKSAGFRQAMLTTKHSLGFCLWPSAYTDFSVKNSPWMGGKGDVVKVFTDAMHAAGMRVGLYYSPWDQKYPSSSANYETYVRNELTELLSNYGPVYELEFDGFQAPRSVNWAGIVQLAKQLQPQINVWMGPEIATTGADLRWIGNENGQASRTSSSVGSVPNGGPSNTWYPFETNVSDRMPNWFWHPNNTVISLSQLESIYFHSVGMNTTLILNVPPATTGQFDAPDVSLLQQFGTWYSSLYRTDLVEGQPATADSTWATAGFDAAKSVDGDVCTYWAAASGKTTARLEITPASSLMFHVISIREPIELGERATGYHVEIKQNGTWNKAPTDASGTKIQGTVIGQRQLWQLNPTTADSVALVIDSAKDVPAIAEFGVY